MFFLGLLISTVLYGIICLLACVFGLKWDILLIIQQALQPTSLTGFFCGFMFWSVLLFPVFVLIHFIAIKIRHKIYGGTGETYIETLFGTLAHCLINPFEGLFCLIGAKKHIAAAVDLVGADAAFSWFEAITHFVWSIIIIAWITLNFIIAIL